MYCIYIYNIWIMYIKWLIIHCLFCIGVSEVRHICIYKYIHTYGEHMIKILNQTSSISNNMFPLLSTLQLIIVSNSNFWVDLWYGKTCLVCLQHDELVPGFLGNEWNSWLFSDMFWMGTVRSILQPCWSCWRNQSGWTGNLNDSNKNIAPGSTRNLESL